MSPATAVEGRLREWFEANSGKFQGDALWGERLAKHTYYRIGGPAVLLAIPKSLSDLEAIGAALREAHSRYFILGAGSNLLVADDGFPGVVIRTHRMNLDIAWDGDACVRTGASVMVFSLLKRAAEEGWSGLEFLTGIPGTMGGVACMNGGTHLGEAGAALEAVEVYSFKSRKLRRIPKADLKYAYRRNDYLAPEDVVWSAEWRVTKGDAATVKAAIDSTLARRKETQPIDKPSCGSVFKNPREHGMHAWQVMDKLGLRGHKAGNAQFSEKHPNFIVNLGGAKASDVKTLIELAKSRAKAELGVTLEEEVKYVGF